MIYHLDTKKLGKEYVLSVIKAAKIREDKKKIYGDTYLEDSIEFLLSQVKNKIKRIDLHFANKTEDNDIEKVNDNILDAVNYLLFLNTVLENKKK